MNFEINPNGQRIHQDGEIIGDSFVDHKSMIASVYTRKLINGERMEWQGGRLDKKFTDVNEAERYAFEVLVERLKETNMEFFIWHELQNK